MTDLRAPAETAVHQCLALGADESCVVVTDDDRLPIGEAIYEVASEVTEDSVLCRYQPGDQHGEEPPEPVAASMAAADVVLAPTTKSVTHTRARSAACEAGARVATLPGITEEVFVTGLDADYESIRDHCVDLHATVVDAEEVRVTSPQGTDVTFEPGDREWRMDTGIVHEPGAMSNLPAGEVFCSPETANGTVVVDGTMMPYGSVEDPITFHVEDGYVTNIEDDGVRKELEAAAEELEDADEEYEDADEEYEDADEEYEDADEEYEDADEEFEDADEEFEDADEHDTGSAGAGDAAYNLAELGIGTNVAVTELVGSVLLDEKAAGTVHVAIGDDHAIGGDTDAPIHLDGILTAPTVSVDGEELALPRAG